MILREEVSAGLFPASDVRDLDGAAPAATSPQRYPDNIGARGNIPFETSFLPGYIRHTAKLIDALAQRLGITSHLGGLGAAGLQPNA